METGLRQWERLLFSVRFFNFMSRNFRWLLCRIPLARDGVATREIAGDGWLEAPVGHQVG